MSRNADSSTLTKLLQARAITFFQTRQQVLANSSPTPAQQYPVNNPQSGNFNNSSMEQLALGSFTTYTQYASTIERSVPPSGILPFPFIPKIDPPISIDTTVLYAFESILTFAIASNYGPTVMSRFLYLYLMSVTQAWNWVQSSPQITGVKDQWDFTAQHSLTYDDSTTWMVLAVNNIMAALIPTNLSAYYDSNYLLNRVQQCHQWSLAVLNENIARIQSNGNWSAYISAYTTWLAYRNADGFQTARLPQAPPNPPNAFPNGSIFLNTNDTVDPNTYPSPKGWTPLWIQATNSGGWTGGSKQRYATYNWNSVLSTCLTASQELDLSGLAAPYFPNDTQRQTEIADLVNITANLTDLEKITAEWWAGGPTTVTPPGIMMWYWKHYMLAYNIAATLGTRAFMLSGLEATIGLFEAGRVVWAQKLAYVQSRPIQEIRRTYRGQSLIGYNGQGVSGESWMPYQEENFVTPPFPDFTSGHSGFSKIFANVMAQWFGDAIDTSKVVTFSDLRRVTPDLTAAQEVPFGSVVFPTGSSIIQPAVVPAAPTTLAFTTWSQLAESAGLSRQYGGIHALSAHEGSLAIVAGLYPMIRAAWGL
jgi:hypothetical protein